MTTTMETFKNMRPIQPPEPWPDPPAVGKRARRIVKRVKRSHRKKDRLRVFERRLNTLATALERVSQRSYAKVIRRKKEEQTLFTKAIKYARLLDSTRPAMIRLGHMVGSIRRGLLIPYLDRQQFQILKKLVSRKHRHITKRPMAKAKLGGLKTADHEKRPKHVKKLAAPNRASGRPISK